MENSGSAKEFLLEDYKYLQELFWKNEAVGETRVNFFITIATAVLGGLIALATSQVDVEKNFVLENIPAFTWRIVTLALSGTLLLGLVTLARLISRNATTDGFIKDMDKIRQRFKDYFDPEDFLEHYVPFTDDYISRVETDPGKLRKGKIFFRKLASRKIGGLTYSVASMNCIVVAGIAASIFRPESFTPIISVVVVSMIAQVFWIRYAEFQSNMKLRKNKITHAGGVVFKKDNDGYKFLLTTAKHDGGIWVFPKGHVEHKESHNDAAVRELIEETGFLSRTIRPLGVNEFIQEKKIDDEIITERVICKYYLMECLTADYREAQEARQIKWLSYTDARAAMKYANARQLLDKANYLLNRVSKS